MELVGRYRRAMSDRDEALESSHTAWMAYEASRKKCDALQAELKVIEREMIELAKGRKDS